MISGEEAGKFPVKPLKKGGRISATRGRLICQSTHKHRKDDQQKEKNTNRQYLRSLAAASTRYDEGGTRTRVKSQSLGRCPARNDSRDSGEGWKKSKERLPITAFNSIGGKG